MASLTITLATCSAWQTDEVSEMSFVSKGFNRKNVIRSLTKNTQQRKHKGQILLWGSFSADGVAANKWYHSVT